MGGEVVVAEGGSADGSVACRRVIDVDSPEWGGGEADPFDREEVERMLSELPARGSAEFFPAVKRVQDHMAALLGLRFAQALLEQYEGDREAFMRNAGRTLDAFLPKLQRQEVKAEMKVDQRVYVEVERREAVIDMGFVEVVDE